MTPSWAVTRGVLAMQLHRAERMAADAESSTREGL